MENISAKRSYTKGITAIVISALGFAGMAFFVKLSGNVPIMQKAIFRNLITTIFAFFMLIKSKEKFYVAPCNRWPLIGRCACGTVGFVSNFIAIEHLPLGDSNILQKLSPFFAIIMSIFILHEKPNRLAIGSVFLALIGAIFVAKPTSGIVSLPALIGVLGGLGAGSAYTFVRKLGLGGVKGSLIIFAFSASSVISILPVAIWEYRPMTLKQTGFLFLSGLCSVVGQVFVTKAYTFAPANAISVFDYTQVLFAALLGFTFLGEIPDFYSIIGYVIIIATAISKWYLERRRDEKITTPDKAK